MSSEAPNSGVPSSMGTTSLPPGMAQSPPKMREIKLISHSDLFYWWPVWALAFFMALWTVFENHRLAIVPADGRVIKLEDGKYQLEFIKEGKALTTNSLEKAEGLTPKGAAADSKADVFPARVSQQAWLGSLFVIVLLVTIVITNVPLRGLWSFIAIIMIVLISLLITLFDGWDEILRRLGNLHIHINLAGYLTIGLAVFAMWALATWVFDRRTYVIFSPGQIRVCEHIGASVQTYPSFGISMEKQRDDLFRHYILGFGSGDLILKVPGADKREIRLPNVLGIGWRLKTIEDTLKTMATTN